MPEDPEEIIRRLGGPTDALNGAKRPERKESNGKESGPWLEVVIFFAVLATGAISAICLILTGNL